MGYLALPEMLQKKTFVRRSLPTLFFRTNTDSVPVSFFAFYCLQLLSIINNTVRRPLTVSESTSKCDEVWVRD